VIVVVVLKICGPYSVEATPDADAVRFPDSSNFRSILPCPDNKNFCDRINDYPSNVNVDDSLLGNTLIKKKIFDDKVKFNSISTRFSTGEKRACGMARSVVYPKKARNVKGQFVFIVNDNKYRQAVEIEQCLNEGQRCLTDDDAPYSETTACKQKYATYKLYAITSDREQVYDSFSLPSACLCHYKSPTSRTSFRSNIRVDRRARRNNLPFCKAGTKLKIQNNDNNHQSEENNKFTQQVSSPISQSYQSQTPTQSQGSRTSISGRRPSRTQDNVWVPKDNQNRQSGNQNRPSGNQNRQSGNQRNSGNQRRNGRTKQDRIFYRQSENRNRRWQRETRFKRAVGCSNTQSTFCESTRDYPENVARTLLLNNPALSRKVFDQVFNGQCTSNIATRGFAIDEEQLCSGTQQVIFPRKARNMDNQWRFVVNIDNFTQSIEVEECKESFGFSQGSDDDFGVCLYSGSEGNNPGLTSCKQVYTEHKLLALTDVGQLEVDRFMLPSACACYIKNGFSLQL